jgi:hypothetical protein
VGPALGPRAMRLDLCSRSTPPAPLPGTSSGP